MLYLWSFHAKSSQLLSSPTKLFTNLWIGVGLQDRHQQIYLNQNSYHLKCAKALFASAILCVSSRFLIEEPSFL